MFPARSLQVAVSVISPSPDEVLLMVQLAGSIPEPPVLSAQFHVTVTSLLFQPLAFAAGDCVGEAVGGVVSAGGLTKSLKAAGALSHRLPDLPPVTLATEMVWLPTVLEEKVTF